MLVWVVVIMWVSRRFSLYSCGVRIDWVVISVIIGVFFVGKSVIVVSRWIGLCVRTECRRGFCAFGCGVFTGIVEKWLGNCVMWVSRLVRVSN